MSIFSSHHVYIIHSHSNHILYTLPLTLTSASERHIKCSLTPSCAQPMTPGAKMLSMQHLKWMQVQHSTAQHSAAQSTQHSAPPFLSLPEIVSCLPSVLQRSAYRITCITRLTVTMLLPLTPLLFTLTLTLPLTLTHSHSLCQSPLSLSSILNAHTHSCSFM